MKAIGEEIGINESRTSQIHAKAIRRLRGKLLPDGMEEGRWMTHGEIKSLFGLKEVPSTKMQGLGVTRERGTDDNVEYYIPTSVLEMLKA